MVLFCLLVSNASGAVGKGAQSLLQNGERLKLTETQRAKITAIVSRTAIEFNKINRIERGHSGLSTKLDAIRKTAKDNALKLLSSEQLQEWTKLLSSSAGNPTKRASATENVATRSLIIPSIEEMKNPPSRGAYGPSTGITETTSHPAIGNRYVILTDHKDSIVLRALARLEKHRNGKILSVSSLGDLYQTPHEFSRVQKALRALNPRYVAIAPKAASYRENMHLCILKLLAGLDEDPSLDVFPGYLMASDKCGGEIQKGSLTPFRADPNTANLRINIDLNHNLNLTLNLIKLSCKHLPSNLIGIMIMIKRTSVHALG